MANCSVFHLRAPSAWLVSPPQNFESTKPEDMTIPMLWEEVFNDRDVAGVQITGHRGGIFKFDFTNYPAALAEDDEYETSVDAQNERLKVMNSFIFILGSTMKSDTPRPEMLLTQSDIALSSRNGTRLSGDGVLVIPNWHSDLRLEWGHYLSTSISREDLSNACRVLERTIKQDYKKSLELTSLVSQSAAFHRRHDFPLSVTAAWTAIEILLKKKWGDLLKEKGVNRKRRDKLEGVDYTASIVIEFLELSGQITEAQYEILNRIRVKRNSWIHSAIPPERQVSQDAVQMACVLLGDLTSTHYNAPMGSSITIHS
jgi:hypothetical protein